LDIVRAGIARLLAAGVPKALVEDKYVGASESNAATYARALYEYSLIPKNVTEGGTTFRSGVKSAGCRRSVSGFRELIIWGGSAP
jgi:hypothetical protein